MGTTRVKVLDLSSDQEVKTSRKHAAKIKPQIETKEEIAQETQVESVAEKTESKKTKGPTSSQKSKSQKHAGKKYKSATGKVQQDKIYTADEALKLLEEISYTKFDPTVEVHFNVSEKNLRGRVNFPHPIGPKKEKRYLVFATNFKTDNKNVIVANDDSVKEISEGRLKPGRDFDAVIASPAYMPKLVSIAKILGPSGMMPNPKNGTITNSPQTLIEGKDSDYFEFRSDPIAPIIHLKLGKLSAKEAKLKDNLKAIILAIGPAKIKKASLSTTMSPSIKFDAAIA